jgi:hypothetical protein
MHSWRWPRKVARYNITCPLQRMLVAKYESQIDWSGRFQGGRIECPESLDLNVQQVLIPRLLSRINEQSDSNNYCQRLPDMDRLLSCQGRLWDDGRNILALYGESAAKEFIIKQCNTQKKNAFNQWCVHLLGESSPYCKHPAFQYLILRPVFESSDSCRMRAPVSVNADALALLFNKILAGELRANQKILECYCEIRSECMRSSWEKERTSSGGLQWIHLSSHMFNAARKLSAVALGTGWCVAIEDEAEHYLKKSDFHILVKESMGCVAMRLVGNNCIEVQGLRNRSPGEWWPYVLLYCSARGFKVLHRLPEADACRSEAENLLAGSPDQVRNLLNECPPMVQFMAFSLGHHGEKDQGVLEAWVNCIKHTPWCSVLAPSWVKSDVVFQRHMVDSWLSRLDFDLHEWRHCPPCVLQDDLIKTKVFSWVLQDPRRSLRFEQNLFDSPQIKSELKASWVSHIAKFPNDWKFCPPEIQLDVLFQLHDASSSAESNQTNHASHSAGELIFRDNWY